MNTANLTDTVIENKHERSPNLDISSDDESGEYYTLGDDDIAPVDDTSYTSVIDSTIHSHAPEGNVSFNTPAGCTAVDSSSNTSGVAVLNVDEGSSSDSENASLIAQGHPSSIAGLLPLNDSASDQSFIDLATSYVDAIDQYLQSANVEDSSATRCLVEPPTSEVHGDVVVPAGITSYNKELDDVGDTRNDSDHHSLAAGIQNDNATSTAVDITK